MVNIGRPSRDCHLCRQRRVKCDLSQPECTRCTRLGKSCPGYRDESDFIFRVESPSSYAEGEKRDRRRKVGTLACGPSSRHPSSDSAKLSVNDLSRTNPNDAARQSRSKSLLNDGGVNFVGWYLFRSTQLSECWDDHAMVLGFSALRSAQRHTETKGLPISLQDMIRDATPDSAVILTCQAVGSAFLTSKISTAEARSNRRTAYGRALTATNSALQDPILQTDDHTLAAVWLLGIYELIVSPIEGSPPFGQMLQNKGRDSWMVHTQGMATLLRLRGTSHFASPTARTLFWLVYNTVQIRCFIAGIAAPTESLTWFRALEQDLLGQELAIYRISVYGYRISAFCAKVRVLLLDGPSCSPNTRRELLAEADHLEIEIQRPWENTEGADDHLHGYSHRQLACRTYYYAFQLKFHLTLLELLNTVLVEKQISGPILVQTQIQLRLASIQNAADQILACVSLVFSIEDDSKASNPLRPRLWTDGARMLWPLRLVALWKGPREDQTRVARKLLYQIKEELGVRHDSVPAVPSASLTAFAPT